MKEYKPIKLNLFKDFLEVTLTTAMTIAIPASIFNLVFATNVIETVLHSLLLMYMTFALTVKAFAWKVKNDMWGDSNE